MTEQVLAEVFHPGEYLRDELEERGWTQIEFAEIIERPVQVVNAIIMGKKGITPETAKAFAAALGTSAEVWLKLDLAYQLQNSRAVSPTIAKNARIRSVYPVREMTRRNWIQPSEDVKVLETRLLRYFEVDTLGKTPKLAHAAKKSGDSEELTPTQYAWLYRVKHIAENMPVPPYSKELLTKAIEELKAYLVAPEEIRHVPPLLAKCGVRLVIVEPLPSSKIDGVCFWLTSNSPSDSPVIGLSLRLDRIDNFWYVLRHEIEHVINGDGKDAPMVDDDTQGEVKEMSIAEQKAHAAAAEFCTPQRELTSFIARVGTLPPRQRVELFAQRLGIHPGVVVGQLQRRLDRYDLFRPLLVPIKDMITSVAMTDGYGHVLPNEA